MWYVYFLQLKNGDIYVGSTNNLPKSLATPVFSPRILPYAKNRIALRGEATSFDSQHIIMQKSGSRRRP